MASSKPDIVRWMESQTGTAGRPNGPVQEYGCQQPRRSPYLATGHPRSAFSFVEYLAQHPPVSQQQPPPPVPTAKSVDRQQPQKKDPSPADTELAYVDIEAPDYNKQTTKVQDEADDWATVDGRGR